MTTDAVVRDPHTFAIIGAAMAVHTELGCGFLESVYCKAMALELMHDASRFARRFPFRPGYKEHTLPLNYRADLVCFERS